MFNYIKKTWLSISLKNKLGFYAIIVILVLGMSVVFNIGIMNFSLNSSNEILDDNSRCQDYQDALEREVKAFEAYMKEQSQQNKEHYRQACVNTSLSIYALPFDYERIGMERYARTWNIRNSYQQYSVYREEVFRMSYFEQAFIPKLYHVYAVQGYLQTYARRLVQVTLDGGNISYQKRVPLYRMIPYMIMLFSVLAVVMILSVTKLMSATMVAPLVQLAHNTRKIAKNDFNVPDMKIENQDEMGELVHAFNGMKHATEGYINTLKENSEMADLLHQEEVEKIKMEKRLDAARLELLKSQINPHFLFNTLNMIACMAKLEDADTTEHMINSMSNLFRYNLKTSEQIVPLEQELKVVEDYIYIQKMRFGSRIQYEKQIAVDPKKIRIPAFTLQPIVENAIAHGLSKKEQGGKIILKIWEQDYKVTISIADTGLGMEEERRQELEAALQSRRTARIGIGLGNIYKRIHALYQDGSLRIYSKKDRGTVIQMEIPQCQEDAEDRERL